METLKKPRVFYLSKEETSTILNKRGVIKYLVNILSNDLHQFMIEVPFKRLGVKEGAQMTLSDDAKTLTEVTEDENNVRSEPVQPTGKTG
jgi:hypothetical protein